MSQNLRNPSIIHRDYGATSTNQMNAINRIPDVTFSPTEFMHLSENIAENIQSVKSSWQQLEKAYKTINKNRNASDSQKERIHNIQAQSNQKIQTTSKDLSKLTAVVKRGDKQQKLLLEKLTSEFQTIVNKYSEIQQQIAKLMKQLVLIAATQQQDEDSAFSNEKDREELLQRQLQMQNGLQFENDLLQDRETKIREIEADVLDVNAIMRELSILVNEQGEQIDTIESSVDHTASDVEAGAAQLLKAAEYRTRYRKKVLILLVIAVIIGLIITGIIVAQFSNK